MPDIVFQENIKKFREETKKLEESETLKKAREKFVSMIWRFSSSKKNLTFV